MSTATSISEVVSWMERALPGFTVVASSEPHVGCLRCVTCFRASRSGDASRILWVTNATLESSLPGLIAQRLIAAGVADLLEEDATLQITVLPDRLVRLQEEFTLEDRERQYSIIRDTRHKVRIIDSDGGEITPPDYPALPISAFERSRSEWIEQIRSLKKDSA